MDFKVLIAPLNWGLGHASRTIPIIHTYLEKGCDVIIASDGDALALLKKEFPELKSYELPSYKITYPFKSILVNVLLKSFSILKAIRSEKKTISFIVKEENPQLIISDNRYGVFDKQIKSVFIGHQIHLKTGFVLLSKIATWFNRKMIGRFSELWIPDFEETNSLAGDLSRTFPEMKYKYLGPLSRFKEKASVIEYDVCAILSGPEPQRSQFANKLIDQLINLEENSVIVLGDMKDQRDEMLNPTTRIIGHMASKELNTLVNQSKIIIARAGYSSIMDLFVLKKAAILVPTPGQSEQIYLAKHLKNRTQFLFQSQNELNIPKALEELSRHIHE